MRNVCTVDGCTRVVNGWGFCLMHYKRFRKYGDPQDGGLVRGPNGETETFLKMALASNTNDCILWPFAKDRNGYGRVSRDGRNQPVHSIVTEKIYGPKPTANHESCHSCGNGHNACINHKHLRWGTRTDNVRDAIYHGTAMFWGRPCVAS